MKIEIITAIIAVLAFVFVVDTVSGIAKEFEIHAQDAMEPDITVPDEIEPAKPDKYHSMIATAYCINGETATGTHTRLGIAASKREWFGKTANVYVNSNGNVGKLIGSYIIEDTGGEPIRNGSVIDLWMQTEDECFAFGRRLVYVEIVD